MPTRILLHGGAGVRPGRDYAEVLVHLREVVEACASALADGRSALETVQQAVRALEDSGLYLAGRGGSPNAAGVVELDAAIMDGGGEDALPRAGSVAALVGFRSPVDAARAVMEATPHVLLAGEGAARFADAQGLARVPDEPGWYRLPAGVVPADMAGGAAALAHGTVGAVALDDAGRLAAATSTAGLFGKLPGRVGDSPIVGGGTWADGEVAISCTGVGEAFLLGGGAYDVAARMAYGGARLDEATAAFLARVAALGGNGGLIALARDGRFAMPFTGSGMKRAVAGEGIATEVAIG